MRLLKILFCFALLCCSSLNAAELPPVEKSSVIVFINGQKFYVHTVKAGDTLFSLAKAYEVGEDVIRQHNNGIGESLRLDQTVKIPVTEASQKSDKVEKRRKKDFITHKVQRGQTLYAIARDYNISVATLREDNPSINPQALSVGETLWIRRTEVGSSTEAEAQEEMAEYVQTLNSVTNDDGYDHYVVQAGETIYSLSRRFGMTEQEFARLNDVSAGLKAGAMIRIPRTEQPQPTAVVAEQPMAQSTAEVHFRALPSSERLNVALMLPINIDNRANASYVEFYQGFLLGLEQLKAMGRGETKLTVYNTAHDPLNVESIVKSTLFEGTNLIVGPVYEDELAPVVQYAEQNSVPIVSPLANISTVQSPALYQLSPATERKYDKVADLIDGEREVYMIYADSYDKEFEAEAKELLHGRPYFSYTYSFDDQKSVFRPRTAETPVVEGMDTILMSEKPRLFVVLANKEVDVDRILGTISSSKVAVSERSIPCAEYTVLGTSRWGRFANIDHTTYFNNNVVMISTYHAKRDDVAVREFDSRYIEAYGALPSLYAYRGYDTAIIFGGGMRSDIEYNMLDKRYAPLQTVYKFAQDGENGKYVNQEWMRVNYNSNYTITIK